MGKALKYWQVITDLAKKKQGAVLESSFEDVNSDTGIEKILKRLGKIFKKNTVDTAYEAFEKFIYFKRESSMNISEYINEYERRYHKAKDHGCELSDSIQGFFLLNQAKISEDHDKLVRATITEPSINEIKTKLIKVFGAGQKLNLNKNDDVKVKVEDVNVTEEEAVNVGKR